MTAAGRFFVTSAAVRMATALLDALPVDARPVRRDPDGVRGWLIRAAEVAVRVEAIETRRSDGLGLQAWFCGSGFGGVWLIVSTAARPEGRKPQVVAVALYGDEEAP